MPEIKCDESVSGELNGWAGGWMEVGSRCGTNKSHAGKCGGF